MRETITVGDLILLWRSRREIRSAVWRAFIVQCASVAILIMAVSVYACAALLRSQHLMHGGQVLLCVGCLLYFGSVASLIRLGAFQSSSTSIKPQAKKETP